MNMKFFAVTASALLLFSAAAAAPQIEKFELDGGYTHFLEGRMDASFGTTPEAMQAAIRLMERDLVDPEKIVSHRFALKDIHKAVEAMGEKNRNKVIINQSVVTANKSNQI